MCTFGEYPSHSKHAHDVDKFPRINFASFSKVLDMNASRIVMKNVNDSEVMGHSKRPRFPLRTNMLLHNTRQYTLRQMREGLHR
jgi:hypothetical protein